MTTRWPQPWIGQPHFSHGSPGSWWARRGGGLAWRMVRQRVHISTVNRPSTSLNGPVEVPQNEQCGPTPHLTRLEPTFDKGSSHRKTLQGRPPSALTRLTLAGSGDTGRRGGEEHPPVDRTPTRAEGT